MVEVLAEAEVAHSRATKAIELSAPQFRRWIVPGVAEGPIDDPDQNKPDKGKGNDADWVHVDHSPNQEE